MEPLSGFGPPIQVVDLDSIMLESNQAASCHLLPSKWRSHPRLILKAFAFARPGLEMKAADDWEVMSN